MSLYATQKFLYHLNRDAQVQRRYKDDRENLLTEYDLTEEERTAISVGDIGKLYVLGCNGQLLMHFAPLLGVAWADYLEAMREGVLRLNAELRAGVYSQSLPFAPAGKKQALTPFASACGVGGTR